MIETVPLGNVVEVSAGQPAPKPADFSDHGHPFIRAGSVEGLLDGSTESECEKINEETATRLRLRLYPRGTVVFAKSGMSAKIGRVYRLRESAYVVSHLATLIPTGEYDPSFLTYWLRQFPPSHLIKDDAYPSIRVSDIAELRVPRVPVEEQQRIAAVLDKGDAICRKREEVSKLADELLRASFLEMFGDPATNSKGLPTSPIKDLGSVVTGNTPPRNNPENYGNGIEWIKSDNINGPNHFLTVATERLSEIGERISRKVPAGSTLVTCIAGSPECIGNAAMTDRAVAFNQQINAIVPGERTDASFLYAQVLLAKKLIQQASTNSMKGMVSKGKFQELEFLAPDFAEQRQFGKIFQKILSTHSTIETASACDRDLFAALSQRAFRGEL